ncbi:MAG: chemotaxis protein CheX [Candidatus Goldbacteria bacterium]|nr:chemotaxis protein CheX [Candidatus Goldiibacteriota bacterium]
MPKYEAALEKVFHDILSKYAMMFGEPVAGAAFKYNPEKIYIRSDVGFTGECGGTMSIITTKDFCSALVSNVMGLEPGKDNKIEAEYDVIKEFINLTCGHFVTEAFGKKVTADLTPPSAEIIDKEGWEIMVKQAEIKFVVDEMPVAVAVDVKNCTGRK